MVDGTKRGGLREGGKRERGETKEGKRSDNKCERVTGWIGREGGSLRERVREEERQKK